MIKILFFILLTLSLNAKNILLMTGKHKASLYSAYLLTNKYNFDNIKFIIDDNINNRKIDYIIKLKISDKNFILADKSIAKSALKVVRELNLQLIEDLFSIKILSLKEPSLEVLLDKNLTLKEQIEFQLIAIEEFLKNLNLNFDRNFEFKNLYETLSNYGKLNINNNITLNLNNIKENLPFFPLRYKNYFEFSNPFGKIIKRDNKFHIYIGSKLVTILFSEYVKVDKSLKRVKLLIDGEDREVKIGSIIELKHNFMIKDDDYRVNIIGFKPKKIKYKGDESNFIISKDELSSEFAIDKSGNAFRVEFYKKDKFLGIIIMKFDRMIE